jgi:hypothetical protein
MMQEKRTGSTNSLESNSHKLPSLAPGTFLTPIPLHPGLVKMVSKTLLRLFADPILSGTLPEP